MGETKRGWEECAGECFRRENRTKPKIERIRDLERGKYEVGINEDLKKISEQERLTKLTTKETEIETWQNHDYAGLDIDGELRELANRKAHGSDGIPGEEYNGRRKMGHQAGNQDYERHQKWAKIPSEWANGAIVYIRKQRRTRRMWKL